MFISVSSQTTLITPAKFFVFALYDASAPGVLLEKVAPPKPYGDPLQISFTYNCLNGHIYIIKLWESVDDTATGIVRNSFSQTMNENSVAIRMDEYLQVGTTAGLTANTTTYTDTSWVNWEYSVERVGEGTMLPDYTGNINPKYHQIDTGGFELIEAGVVFQEGENYVVRFTPQVIAAVSGTPSGFFSTGRIITANETLTASDKGKALILQSTTSALTVTAPLLATINDFTDLMHFFSNGGNHKNATIAMQGTDKVQFNGLISSVILGQGEKVSLFKAFGYYWPLDDLPGMRMVGGLLYSYGNAELNTLECAGQLVSRATYPRLWAFVQSLAVGSVVTDANWSAHTDAKDGITINDYNFKFSSGDGSTTFRLPLLTNVMLKGLSGGNVGGYFEWDQGIDHQHETSSHYIGTSFFGRGLINRIAGLFPSFTNDKADLTSVPLSPSTTATLTRMGTENRVRTAGAYCLIRY